MPIEEVINISAMDKTEIWIYSKPLVTAHKGQTITHLFYHEDMSINDISDILKLKESAVNLNCDEDEYIHLLNR